MVCVQSTTRDNFFLLYPKERRNNDKETKTMHHMHGHLGWDRISSWMVFPCDGGPALGAELSHRLPAAPVAGFAELLVGEVAELVEAVRRRSPVG